MTQRYGGKRVCGCWCIAPFFLCRVFSCLPSCNCVRKRMRAWLPTRVRRHFEVLSYRPEKSESRFWHDNGDGDVLSNLFVCTVFLCFEEQVCIDLTYA